MAQCDEAIHERATFVARAILTFSLTRRSGPGNGVSDRAFEASRDELMVRSLFRRVGVRSTQHSVDGHPKTDGNLGRLAKARYTGNRFAADVGKALETYATCLIK